MESQNKAVLKHLKKRPITALEAVRLYGILRLSARILNLRSYGHIIATQMITVNGRKGEKPKHVAQYRLVKAKKEAA